MDNSSFIGWFYCVYLGCFNVCALEYCRRVLVRYKVFYEFFLTNFVLVGLRIVFIYIRYISFVIVNIVSFGGFSEFLLVFYILFVFGFCIRVEKFYI